MEYCDAELWNHVRSIVEESNVAFTSTADEIEWDEIVRPLLERGMGNKKGDLFKVKPMYGYHAHHFSRTCVRTV